jgi:hypothetical protein
MHASTYLVIIGIKRLQALLHDMVGIRILDELQEPRAEGLHDEPYLLLCPEALDQLLHCPRPEKHTTHDQLNVHTLAVEVAVAIGSENRIDDFYPWTSREILTSAKGSAVSASTSSILCPAPHTASSFCMR